MTTILSGGRYEKADPGPDTVAIAVEAARHFGLVFTGVDLIEDSDGRFNVLEVSAFGGFRGLLNGCGVDAAPMLADVVLRQFSQVWRGGPRPPFPGGGRPPPPPWPFRAG